MNSIVYVNSYKYGFYNKFNFWNSIKDRFKINLEKYDTIDELKMPVYVVQIPPNINKKSYMNNIRIAKKFSNEKNCELALNIHRIIDYALYSNFQKRFLAYSVVKSIKLYLRVNKKNIENSCIVVYDACDDINFFIIEELSKYCKYIILISNNFNKMIKIREYILAQYGISIIITKDVSFALQHSDFIVTSRNITPLNNKTIWYLDNVCYYKKDIIEKNEDIKDNNKEENNNKNEFKTKDDITLINDVIFKIPWKLNGINADIQLVASILEQMGRKDIDELLRYNGIYIENMIYR